MIKMIIGTIVSLCFCLVTLYNGIKEEDTNEKIFGYFVPTFLFFIGFILFLGQVFVRLSNG